MKRAHELERRLRALDTLGQAMGAMKNLAAHHFLAARGAVEPSRVYRDAIEQLMTSTAVSLPAGEGGRGLVVLGGELGLCGGYHARLVAFASGRRAPYVSAWCVGRRTRTLLARRGMTFTRQYAAPSSVAGIPALVTELAEDLLQTYARDRLAGLDVLATRFAGVGAVQPSLTTLLPFTARSPAHEHVRYVSRAHWADTLLREYLYVQLYDLLLDALACEHGERLLATQAAERWLDERSEQVRRQLAACRREASTQEVIEIAAGARPLQSASKARLTF